ncbi:MAG: peptidylprolyl isomerase [Nitrospinae bacterium RIFCSPLOWO2_12_FULL_47_7]|nr:MAG: peptidylprolyl isomerase [Nitrospinae bacterium RIFCSPLOWO2_12_FULL_47_7]
MIKKNSVVTLKYCLKNLEGKQLEQTTEKEPLSYLHGSGQIVPGLEAALAGLKTGDKKEVTILPAQGYGEVVPEMRIKVDIANFPKERPVEEGMEFIAEVDGGHQHPFTVIKIEENQVYLDGNHPLAGQTLHFAVEVIAVRDATKEELTHGHAHGHGGAHAH